MQVMKTLMVFIFLILFIASMAGVGEECPKANKITKMSSSMDSFKAVAPLDFSTIKSGGALLKKDGTKMDVVLSNTEFPIKQMASSFVVPIKQKEHFIASMTFSNAKQKIVPGTYSAASGYGKPFWITAEVKLFKPPRNVIVSLSVREGTAKIVKMTEDSVCGVFNLKSKKPGLGELSGQFNVKLETSRF